MALITEEHPRRGHTVQGPGMANFVCYIKRGAARVYYTRRGRERTVSFAFDDQFLVVPQSMINRYGDTIAIEFLEPSEILLIPSMRLRDELAEVVRDNESATLLFMNLALRQYSHRLEEFLAVALTYNARDRYLWAIKQHPRLTQCATLTQIASYLGMTKETLYRLRASLNKNSDTEKQ